MRVENIYIQCGLPSRTRTCGLRLRKPLLHPSELWGESCLAMNLCIAAETAGDSGLLPLLSSLPASKLKVIANAGLRSKAGIPRAVPLAPALERLPAGVNPAIGNPLANGLYTQGLCIGLIDLLAPWMDDGDDAAAVGEADGSIPEEAVHLVVPVYAGHLWLLGLVEHHCS